MEFWDYHPKGEVIGGCCEFRVARCVFYFSTRNPQRVTRNECIYHYSITPALHHSGNL